MLLGCTVAELLQRMSAYEITEWEAFERANGPLGNAYMEEMLAQIQEQLQVVSWLQGAQGEDNPVPEPKPILRPRQLYEYITRPQKADPDEVDQETFDAYFG